LIDLRSDTVTRPSPDMRRAMAEAEVGDDVYGEDPTVARLEARAAELVGKAAALFVPSGTMANQLAIRAQTEPGDALIAQTGAHCVTYEGGGAAALCGVDALRVGADGAITADEIAVALPPDDDHFPRARLVCLENTHNRSGGRALGVRTQREIAALAAERGLRLHLDGARLFNAALAAGVSVRELAEPFDTVAFCLSKGLGAPVGSLLCGARDTLRRARRFRKMLGGGMRQVGILAAAGLYALDHNVARLAEDHAHAARLAAGLAEIPGLAVMRPPESNIVVFVAPDAPKLVARARERGLRMNALDARSIRAVTHMDVSASDVDRALATLRECVT
jgi:threonine aldolase